MKRKCAWCGKDMGPVPGTRDDGVTHGICRDCRNFFERNVPGELADFMDGMDVPVMLVDFEAKLLAANRTARRQMRLAQEKIEGSLPGDVVECRWARLPGGCGKQTHCLGCVLRACVNKTFETGQSIFRQEAWLDRMTPDGKDRRVRLVVSTVKRNEVVFMRIDGWEPD